MAEISWQQWLMAGGSLILSPIVFWLWVEVDKLKSSVATLPHKAQEEATRMDDKVWAEIRAINDRLAQHQTATTNMHIEATRALGDIRVEMQKEINAGVDRVIHVIREHHT